MQVILLHDVEALGHEGDVVNVAGGYARNHLLPRKLAVLATRGALRELDQRGRAIARRQTEKAEAAAALGGQLADKVIVLRAHVGEGGRLHGQITPQMIAVAVREQVGLELNRRDIEIPEPIRAVGDFFVRATLYKGVQTQLALSVVPEHGEVEPTGEAAAAYEEAAAAYEQAHAAAEEAAAALEEPEQAEEAVEEELEVAEDPAEEPTQPTDETAPWTESEAE